MSPKANDIITNGRYENMGKIIDDTVVANTALTYSAWFKADYLWVRNLMVTLQVDQSYDLYVFRKTPEDIADWGSALISAAGSTGTSNYATAIIALASGGLLGYWFRFGIKNVSGGAATTKAILYAQCFN